MNLKISWRRNKKFLFEILAVFIGLTASFWLEEYRQNRDDRRQELKLLTALAAELDTVCHQLEWKKAALEQMIDVHRHLARHLQPQRPDVDSVGWYLIRSAPYRRFQPLNAALRDIITAENFARIRDDRLRRAISLYESGLIEYSELEEQLFMFQWGSYYPYLERFAAYHESDFSRNVLKIPTGDTGVNITGLANNREFLNKHFSLTWFKYELVLKLADIKRKAVAVNELIVKNR